MQQSQFGDSWIPGADDGSQLEGPDYVALVIEWDDELDEMRAESLDDEPPVELRPRLSHRLRNVAIACGTAGVLALVTWRLRRRLHR